MRPLIGSSCTKKECVSQNGDMEDRYRAWKKKVINFARQKAFVEPYLRGRVYKISGMDATLAKFYLSH